METTFKTILADPPWPYTSPRAVVGNGGRGSDGESATYAELYSGEWEHPSFAVGE